MANQQDILALKMEKKYSVKVEDKQSKINSLKARLIHIFFITHWNVSEVKLSVREIRVLLIWRSPLLLFLDTASVEKKIL